MYSSRTSCSSGEMADACVVDGGDRSAIGKVCINSLDKAQSCLFILGYRQ